MTIREEIRRAIQTALREAGHDGAAPFSVGPPAHPGHGDYATNAALVLAQQSKKPPLEIAAALAAALQQSSAPLVADVRVAAPGFINITLADRFLTDALNQALADPDQWWRSSIGNGKTVRVEYFQLNIAKRPHIGHLRSAVIGDAIKRILLSQGYKAVSDTHVGDWGTQFGILLYALKQVSGEMRGHIEDDPLSRYETLYSLYSGRGDFEEMKKQGAAQETTDWKNIHERGKEEFAKLEHGDAENRRIWERVVEVSMAKLEESAHKLGLAHFDMHRGESFYEDKMAPIAELALRKGVAKKTTDGAVVADLTADGLDEAVLVKSDGASTYLFRDLATIQYMKRELNFAVNLYVVDVRQSHHFRQVFRVAELLGFEGVGESRHIEFGFMSLPEGPMSTRGGTAISLDVLLFEAGTRASKIIKEKNPGLKDRDLVAKDVGLGAIKYFDLSHHRRSDIVFRWDEALAFEGNSGPYLQYAHARLKSILRKSGVNKISDRIDYSPTLDATEHHLLAFMSRLPEAIEDALEDYTPNTLANYLYSLAKLANEFYHSHPVMQEPDEAKRQLRFALVAGVANTLSKGLDLLGIAAPEEM